jgi:hypothetical protein
MDTTIYYRIFYYLAIITTYPGLLMQGMPVRLYFQGEFHSEEMIL